MYINKIKILTFLKSPSTLILSLLNIFILTKDVFLKSSKEN